MLWMEKSVGKHLGALSLIPRGGMTVSSGADEEAVVQRGAAAVREVLLGDDLPLIRSLMCCLDGHFDPYYHTLLPDECEICHALEELIVKTRVPDIAETACDLLGASTAARNFPVLLRDYQKVMRFIQPEVRALLAECGTPVPDA